jgi:hypothetical protein
MLIQIRAHVKKFATLLKGREVVRVDDKLLRSACSAIEGTESLIADSPPDMPVPLTMTAAELRNFVAYMRALDNIARKTSEMEERCVKAELAANQARMERDEVHGKLKVMEGELEKGKKAAQAVARTGSGDGKRRASRATLILRRAARAQRQEG